MHNVRTARGTFKGYIGECMFKMTRRWAHLTWHKQISDFLGYYGKFLSPEQEIFLRKYWRSIDAVEILIREREMNLYEIKTKNKYYNKLGYKPKMTAASCEIYEKAWTLGFNTKLATVTLHNDWNYEVEIKDFSRDGVHIDKPKLYDRAGSVT